MAETMAEQADRERAEALAAEADRQKSVDKDMDAESFVVLAPYVTLKIKDDAGGFVVRGYNEGGVFTREEIDEDNLRHHLDTGLVAPVGSKLARFAGPAGTPKPGEPPNVPVTEQPVASLPLAERLQRQADAADKAEKDAKAPRAAKAAPTKANG
jgi:hypothetical protein